MKRYYLVEIYTSQLIRNMVSVKSTHPWVLGKLQELVEAQLPGSEVATATLPNDHPYQYTFRVKKGEATRYAWWLLQVLCKQGWEPFSQSSTRFQSGEGEEAYLLRWFEAKEKE